MKKANYPEIIESSRLILTKSSIQDSAFFYSCLSNPDIIRYTTWKPIKLKSQIERYLTEMDVRWHLGVYLNYVITEKVSDQKIGVINYNLEDFSAKIGFLVIPEKWGQGYATEAAKAVVDLLINRKEIMRIWSVCDTKNLASVHVLEKIGMQKEGILRKWEIRPNIDNKPADCFCYSIVK